MALREIGADVRVWDSENVLLSSVRQAAGERGQAAVSAGLKASTTPGRRA
ncbi:hypothetical protein FA95DRAFT_1610147 [Auriscalpium vulgare]|uniref:Uncharacterized protein n=1 Tax=Auriscalpium vulgare TaxID=40419 RepID=A0ACB8REI4_9AGAM|nr:hypothetical protein FA95DRAFT_1610147 [Auriscalpium vulgare]